METQLTLNQYLCLKYEQKLNQSLDKIISDNVKQYGISKDYYLTCILQGLVEESIEEVFISNHITWIDDTMIDMAVLLTMSYAIKQEIDYYEINEYAMSYLKLNIYEYQYLYQNLMNLETSLDTIKKVILTFCEAIVSLRRRDLYELLLILIKLGNKWFKEDMQQQIANYQNKRVIQMIKDDMN